MIIPIFIHIKEKSDKELLEEMERESKWRKLMEQEELRQKEKEAQIKREKLLKKEQERKLQEQLYDEMKYKDEWQTQILPEGWNIFGQTSIPILTEFFKD